MGKIIKRAFFLRLGCGGVAALQVGVKTVVRRLHLGDFLWLAKERVAPLPGCLELPPSRELVLDYVVERKRMDDFAASIADGRFREQK